VLQFVDKKPSSTANNKKTHTHTHTEHKKRIKPPQGIQENKLAPKRHKRERRKKERQEPKHNTTVPYLTQPNIT
jgi:hypothetical protein